MTIILNRAQARHILEWTKSITETEQTTAAEKWAEGDLNDARRYFQRKKTWVYLSTKLKEGLKRESPKRKPRPSSD